MSRYQDLLTTTRVLNTGGFPVPAALQEELASLEKQHAIAREDFLAHERHIEKVTFNGKVSLPAKKEVRLAMEVMKRLF